MEPCWHDFRYFFDSFLKLVFEDVQEAIWERFWVIFGSLFEVIFDVFLKNPDLSIFATPPTKNQDF